MLKPFNSLAQLRSSGPPSTCCCTPGQKIARKYRKAHRRRIQRKEYRNLKKIVPSVAAKDKVSKVTVIEEAIRYIDELHHALAKRLQASQGFSMPISVDCIEHMAQQSFLAKKRAAASSNIPSHPGQQQQQLHNVFPIHLLTRPPVSRPLPLSASQPNERLRA